MHADIANVVGVLHLIASRAQHVADRHAQHAVAQMPDVELLVGVRLGVLHHHLLGDRGALTVGRAARQHLVDQRGSNRVAVKGDVDVAVDRLYRAEERVAAGCDVLRDLLRQDRYPFPDGARRQGFRFFLGKTLQLPAGLQFARDGFVGEAVCGRGGQAPGAFERNRPHIDIARGETQGDKRFRNRLRRLLLATRHDPDPVTAA